ncbi:hypothetical protein AND_008834 [Anopheles darlingi]|uniref:Uncharacterized protein n=1 Tax=Anopheles darlingi TaxID=43151 RepID=W5J9X3_ANODA|nr:hypothetical protein AND_008834 [Anopheles darlingi]
MEDKSEEEVFCKVKPLIKLVNFESFRKRKYRPCGAFPDLALGIIVRKLPTE